MKKEDLTHYSECHAVLQSFKKVDTIPYYVPERWEYQIVNEIDWEKRSYSVLRDVWRAGKFDENGQCLFEDYTTVFKDRILPLAKLPEYLDLKAIIDGSWTFTLTYPLYEPDYEGHNYWLKLSTDMSLNSLIIANYFYDDFKKKYPHSYLFKDSGIRVFGVKNKGDFYEYLKTISDKCKIENFCLT